MGAAKGHVLGWDTAERRILWDTVVGKDQPRITSLHYIAGSLWGTASKGLRGARHRFFRMDARTGKLRHMQTVPFAPIIRNNLRLGPDGWLYGLSYVGTRDLFRIHPQSGAVEAIARLPDGARGYALAVTRDGLYFGKGARLMRFVFDEPLAVAKRDGQDRMR